MFFINEIILLSSSTIVAVEAFFISFTERRQQQRPTTCSCCWAKPPPTANFDLVQIEAYEAELLAKEEEEQLLNNDDNLYEDDYDEDETTIMKDNNIIRTYTIPESLHNKRIDAVVTDLLSNDPELTNSSNEYSRSFCGHLVTDGMVSDVTNNKNVKVLNRKSYKVSVGQTIRIQLSNSNNKSITEIIAQDIPLDIIYEDEYMIVINKAAHMVVHPAPGNWDNTIVNSLAYYLQYNSPYGSGEFVNNNDTDTSSSTTFLRPGIVHRLDKGTTGVLIIAKTNAVLTSLSEQFAKRKVKKTYLAITIGNPGENKFVIDKPIGRHPIHRQIMRVVPEKSTTTNPGRRALSLVETLSYDGKLSFVMVKIATGRTHQIRVHLADNHTPIYGDDIYGIKDWNKRLLKKTKDNSNNNEIIRPLLHAFQLEIQHPITGELMQFQAPMASDMIEIVNTIYPQGIEERPDIFTTSSSSSSS